jgi:hypothetical protein
MTELEKAQQEVVAAWRRRASEDNPAGPLFTGGDFTEAEIVLATVGGSGRCGTACSGSSTRFCC